MADPRTTYTTFDFIKAGKSIDLKFSSLALQEKLGDIKFPVFNVVDDYWEEIKEKAKSVTLNNEEFLKYKYRPRLLADFLYDNGDLYWILLIINNCASVKDFHKNPINVLTPTDMENLLTSILNAEKPFISKYNSSHNI